MAISRSRTMPLSDFRKILYNDAKSNKNHDRIPQISNAENSKWRGEDAKSWTTMTVKRQKFRFRNSRWRTDLNRNVTPSWTQMLKSIIMIDGDLSYRPSRRYTCLDGEPATRHP